jgi:hypothetical protein
MWFAMRPLSYAGSLTGFPVGRRRGGRDRRVFSWGEAEGGAKEDLGRPAPGEGHKAHAFLEVAVAGQQFVS